MPVDPVNNENRSSLSHKFEYLPTKTWREYIFKRMVNSNLCTCWYYDEMDINDSDTIINSVTVVNALLLTIPFQLVGAFNADFWEWEMNNIANCNNGTYNQTSGQFNPPELNETGLSIYLTVSTDVFECAFSSSIGLVLATIYYTLRPRNQSTFKQWWPRGKFSLILILIFTALAIISLLRLFGMSVGLLLSSNQYTCHAIPGKNHSS